MEEFEHNGKVYISVKVDLCENCTFKNDVFLCGSVNCGEFITEPVIWVEKDLNDE